MKKLILGLAMAGLFITQTHAQDLDTRDVPTVVITTFNGAYPTVSDVEWEREGTYYVASYDNPNHRDMYVVYDNAGKLIQTRERISDDLLPAAVMGYVKTNYKEDELRHVYKLTDSNGNVYYKGRVKGNYLYFDQNGNFIKASTKKNDWQL